MTAEIDAPKIAAPGERAAPLEGAVDWQQLRAVVGLNLKQGFRAAHNPRTGKRAHPVRQIIVSMGLIGLFFSSGARRCDDLPTFLAFLFCASFAIAALSVLPDTLDGRRRNFEVLVSKPISSATLLAARAVNLLIIATVITGSFSVVPLISAAWLFECSLILAGALFLLLIIGSFAVVVISLTTLLVAAQWFSIDRLRTFAQFLLVAINLSLMGSSFLLSTDIVTGAESTKISIASIPSLKLLPSVWFSDFLVSDFGLMANLERAGALAVVMCSVLIAMRLDLGKRYPKLIDRLLESDDRPTNPLLTVGLLEAVSRVPLLGQLVRAQPLAIATLILTLTHREVMSRLKILAPRAILIAFFVVSLGVGDRYFSPMLIASYGFIALLTGCELLKETSQPAACWPLLAAPVDAIQIINGLRLAVTVKYVALPAALVIIALFLTSPPILAGLLALCYLVETRCVISALIMISPALPLSREHATTAPLLGMGASLGVTLVTTIGYVVVVLIYSLHQYVGLALGGVSLMGLIFTSYWLDRGAASRLAVVQYEH
jgi:hypothetical protein